jgi:hypothetical protein
VTRCNAVAPCESGESRPVVTVLVTRPPHRDKHHSARTHLALDKDAPEPRAVERLDQGRIVETPLVGGLITGTAAAAADGCHRPH